MCDKCEDLQQQIVELKNLVARGFGQLAKSSDPAAQQAAEQVSQTLKRSKRPKN